MIVDVALYVDGLRSAPCPLEGMYHSCREVGGFAWVGLYEPTEEEFVSVTGEFDLHKLAVVVLITVLLYWSLRRAKWL